MQIAEVEYNKLISCSQDFKVRNVGHYALRWLQSENGIPTYGTDYSISNTPRDLTLATHQVDLKKVCG